MMGLAEAFQSFVSTGVIRIGGEGGYIPLVHQEPHAEAGSLEQN